MDTKHTRVVVTLLWAVATLATMGFSTGHNGGSASLLPDHATCELGIVPLTAIELLEFIDDPCYADLVDQVENEINWGYDSSLSTRTLLDSILAQSRSASAWPVDLLELSETEAALAGSGAVFSDPGIHERVSLVTWDDIGIYLRESLVTWDDIGIYPRESLIALTEIGIYPRESLVTVDDIGVYPRESLVTWDDIGIYPRESLVTWDDIGIYPRESLVTEADLGILARVSLVTRADLAELALDWSIEYHNPSSPRAEYLQLGSAPVELIDDSAAEAAQAGPAVTFSAPRIYDRVSLIAEDDLAALELDEWIVYNNPSSPWAEYLQLGSAARPSN